MDNENSQGYPADDLFAAVRFAGGRFDRHVVPFDVLGDLSAYRDILIELAKSLYRNDHPERRRVPKGFAAAFHLALSDIVRGQSAVLNTVQMQDDANPQARLHLRELDSYFAQARDAFVDIVGAANDGVYDNLPSLLEKIDRFGKHLRDDEFIELRNVRTSKLARFSSDTRRKILSHGPAPYEMPLSAYFELNGIKASQHVVHLFNGAEEVDAHDVPEEYVASIAERNAASGRVFVSGTGVYAKDTLQKIVDVEEILFEDEALAREALVGAWRRVAELAELKPGWFDGSGSALNTNAAAWFIRLLSVIFRDEASRLAKIFPLEDGGLRAEWRRGRWDVSMEVSGQEERPRRYYIHALNMDSLKIKEDESTSDDRAHAFVVELDSEVEGLKEGADYGE